MRTLILASAFASAFACSSESPPAPAAPAPTAPAAPAAPAAPPSPATPAQEDAAPAAPAPAAPAPAAPAPAAPAPAAPAPAAPAPTAAAPAKATPTKAGPVKAPPKGAPAGDKAAAQKEARELFAGRCTPCHGPQGGGDGPLSKALNPPPRNFHDGTWQASVTDEHIEKIIKQGGAAVGKSALMPPNPDLDGKPAVVAALRAHIRSLKQ